MPFDPKPFDEPHYTPPDTNQVTVSLPAPIRLHVAADAPKGIGALSFHVGLFFAFGAAMGASVFVAVMEMVKTAAAWVMA